MSDTLAKLGDIIRKEFANFTGDVTAETTAYDVDGWDSLAHGMLVLRIENEFGKTIDDDAAYEFENVGAIATYLDEH